MIHGSCGKQNRGTMRHLARMFLLAGILVQAACGPSEDEISTRGGAPARPQTLPTEAKEPISAPPLRAGFRYVEYPEFPGWEAVDPIEFLEVLVDGYPEGLEREDPGFASSATMTIEGYAPAGWITERHVEELFRHSKSSEPSLCVMSNLSSAIGCVSTRGEQALFLIEGFQTGVYPSRICSGMSKQQIETIHTWWNERN